MTKLGQGLIKAMRQAVEVEKVEKPREYWLDHDCYYTKKEIEFSKTTEWPIDETNLRHVIEHKALTQSQRELEACKQAITKALDHLEMFNFAKDPTRVAHADTILREALAKIGDGK